MTILSIDIDWASFPSNFITKVFNFFQKKKIKKLFVHIQVINILPGNGWEASKCGQFSYIYIYIYIVFEYLEFFEFNSIKKI